MNPVTPPWPELLPKLPLKLPQHPQVQNQSVPQQSIILCKQQPNEVSCQQSEFSQSSLGLPLIQLAKKIDEIEVAEDNIEFANNTVKKGTIGNIIESIEFEKKQKNKKESKKNNQQISETSSKSSLSSYEIDPKCIRIEQSKSWSGEEQQIFIKLLNKFGTDFNMIKQYFPKKSKNQIKNKYKQLSNSYKKGPPKNKKVDPFGLVVAGDKESVQKLSEMKEVNEMKQEEENEVLK